MRIGVLTTSYPRDADDPSGQFVAGFAGWLAAHVGEVEVLAAAATRPLFYGGSGAPGKLAAGGREGVGAWLEAAAFSTALAGQAAARAGTWDALVTHWLVPSAAVGMALARGRPHLAIAHGSDVRLLARLPAGASIARAVARTSDLVYVAAALAIPGAPGRVVPMGIDRAAFAGGDREGARARLGLEGFVALFMGRLVPDKGADLAAAALPEGATLVVAGDGPERARLAGLRGVRLLGEVRGAARRDLYAAADVVVVPSRVDGAPVVVREAFAAGRPVVATRAGGLAEMIDDGATGILCDATAESLGAALVRLGHDPAACRTLGAAAARASAAYDWETVGPLLAGQLARAPGSGDVSVVRV